MREHTYSPPQVDVLAPGDGSRVLVCLWADEEHPERTEAVYVVLDEASAKGVAHKLLSPSVLPATHIPPGLVPRL